ncbi:MAG: hypothetical protein EOO99_11520 [Pedobacter sp.]|nr:MAG: hypothetical protein EOO99_11520 [Pedobacter sp.]
MIFYWIDVNIFSLAQCFNLYRSHMVNVHNGLNRRENIKLFHKLNPEVLLVFPDNITKAWLSIWEPYLLASSFRVAVIAKSDGNKDLANVQLPIFFSDSGISIGQLLKAKSLKIFLYPTNRPNNFGYINKFPHIKHVFIGHGDSDKLSSSSRFSTVYDYLLVADRGACFRYSSRGVFIPKERFLPIGAPTIPNLDVIITNKNKKLQNLLYAPTSEGKASDSNFSSLCELNWEEAFKNLLDKGYVIDFRSHPGAGERLDIYKSVRQKLSLKYSKKMSKTDSYNLSDVIICDISGVMSEFLFTGKPIIVPVHKNDLESLVIKTIQSSNIADFVYLWDINGQPLESFLQSIEDDPLFNVRFQRRELKFLGSKTFDESSGKFNRALELISLSCDIDLLANSFF